MKKMGWLVPLLLLAGCEPLQGSEGAVWTASTREATVSLTESMATSVTECTFNSSTRKLIRTIRENGPGGQRWQEDERLLSADQAARYEELLAHIQLDDTSKPGDCWNDVPSLNLRLVDDSGESRLYYTDPEKESCGRSEAFVVKEDVLAVLDLCNALLPEPL
ncbi:hypothetical protein JQX13_33120 [Archangium violaceum]|uniref:hypothetical protein n=1 Tax=Archangium violaceum TaxID=83451 RepID=UPI00193C05CE|nr:hypothetical protein [Archangium violaceum]QRK05029.1 hypothetical protein JQX13_33120 [Archangium violaceum]